MDQTEGTVLDEGLQDEFMTTIPQVILTVLGLSGRPLLHCQDDLSSTYQRLEHLGRGAVGGQAAGDRRLSLHTVWRYVSWNFC